MYITNTFLTSYVTLGHLFNLCVTEFPHLQNRGTAEPKSQFVGELREGVREMDQRMKG